MQVAGVGLRVVGPAKWERSRERDGPSDSEFGPDIQGEPPPPFFLISILFPITIQASSFKFQISNLSISKIIT
jgi:hypothetical protein